MGQKASSAPTVSLAMGQKHQPGRNTPDVTSSGRCVWVEGKVCSFECVCACVCVFKAAALERECYSVCASMHDSIHMLCP